MNQLTRLTDFQEVLADYQLSDEAGRLLRQLQLVLLIGPSSSGRNTIINELLKSGKYHSIVSDTTRQPRTNDGVPEQNGREYWFRAESDVLHDLQDGQFLEAAIIHQQQVSGTSIRELATAAQEQKIAIGEIEIVGAANVHNAKPDTQFIFVVPPSFNEWIARMRIRGELPAAETLRRLQSAIAEIDFALGQDYFQFVVNGTFMDTARQIDNLIHGEAHIASAQAAAQAIARQILDDTKAYLADHC